MYKKSTGVLAILCLSSVSYATAPASPKKPNVVAIVNGSEISLESFIKELYRAEQMVLNRGRVLTAPEVTRLRTEVLEALVRDELLSQESAKAVTVTDKEIAEEMEKLKDRLRTSDFTPRCAPG
jgi:hypothetical protein